jgi:8-oxo-dGTP pyrophosphatase MutT (NUDIX family)
MSFNVLVVAGGTEEKIDDVRTLVNDRPYGLGLALARAFHESGADVQLLAGKRLRERSGVCNTQGLGEYGDFTVEPFSDYFSLRDALKHTIGKRMPDMVVMAASVSDWLPAEVTVDKYYGGKHEMRVTLIKAPSLVTELRETYGAKMAIVATVSIPDRDGVGLLEKARSLMARANLDMVIAFDRRTEEHETRNLLVVTPEGGVVPFVGADFDLGPMIAEFIAKRQRVTPVPMWQGNGEPPVEAAQFARRVADRLISFAKNASSYSGTSGNLSVRVSATDMLVSPSGVDKRMLTPEELVFVQYDPTEPGLAYTGIRKPSIDTNMQSAIYRRFPHIESIFHVHADAGLFLTDATTSFPFPCGTQEEATDLIDTIKSIGQPEDRFSVELIHHGYMLGLENGGAERLGWEYHSAAANWIGRLYDLKMGMMFKELTARPIFNSTRIVGVIAEHYSRNWVAVMLLPPFRKTGLGELLAEQLTRLGKPIKAHDDAGMTRWLCTHGWQIANRDGSVSTLIPPSARTDLGYAATICLIEPSTRRVLLGKRKHSPWKDAWACPGGNMKPFETAIPFACARRELREETGISLPHDTAPSLVYETHVGTYRGTRAFRVTGHMVFVDSIPEHFESIEILPQVFTVDEALETLPMGRGTKALLRKVRAELDRRATTKID